VRAVAEEQRRALVARRTPTEEQMYYPHVGPRRDHLRLNEAEERALVELERSLRSTRGLRLRWAARRPARWLFLLLPAVRLAPWLIPVGTVVMVAAIPVSVPISFAGALLLATGLAAGLDRVARRVRLRRAR
jgi:hypothetical protein